MSEKYRIDITDIGRVVRLLDGTPRRGPTSFLVDESELDSYKFYFNAKCVKFEYKKLSEEEYDQYIKKQNMLTRHRKKRRKKGAGKRGSNDISLDFEVKG